MADPLFVFVESVLVANAAGARVEDAHDLGCGQGGVVHADIVDGPGEGTVFVDFLADGEP